MRTFLKVLSLCMMVLAVVLMVISGIMIASAVVVHAVAPDMLASDADYARQAAIVNQSLPMFIYLLVLGVFVFVTGLFGLKGAGGNEHKLRISIVLGWIWLALSLANCAATLISGQANASLIVTPLMPVLFLVAVNQVKKLPPEKANQKKKKKARR